MRPEGTQDFRSAAGVFCVFNEVSKALAVSKSHTFDLLQEFQSRPKSFGAILQQGYLKVFKSLHEKSNKKIPNKFEELAENFFRELLEKYKDEQADSDAVKLFNGFLQLQAEAIYSSIMNIRIMAARTVFKLMKLLPGKGETAFCSGQTQVMISKGVYFLLRQKVSSYKEIGIKIGSLVLGWSWREESQYIEEELFRIMALEDNEQTRKMAITNLVISQRNIDRVLVRLRDKLPEVRTIIVRKLTGQQYLLQQLTLSNLYKLLYDGYGNKDQTVSKETLNYFALFFQDDKRVMQVENKFEYFVRCFYPNLMLANPHIYVLFDRLIGDLLNTLSTNLVVDYVAILCAEIHSQVKSNKQVKIGLEVVWLKNAAKSDHKDIRTAFEQACPSGVEMARMLEQLQQSKSIYEMYEVLQLFSLQKTPDEIGRNKMFDALKEVLAKLSSYEVQIDYARLSEDDDVCLREDEALLRRKKLILSYYDLPIISESLDLVMPITAAMKVLRPDHYEIEIKQIMADWNNPEEDLQKEHQRIASNITKIQDKKDAKHLRMVDLLSKELAAIEAQIQRGNTHTCKVVLALSRLKSNAVLDGYMNLIKTELSKQDQSEGLLLLGLYCLENSEKVSSFLQLYWKHLSQPDAALSHQLVSLKVVTDFALKFDMTRVELDDSVNYSFELFLKQVMKFTLSCKPELKILAIESLCRLVFHSRVEEDRVGYCFMYLLLLWWETSPAETSAKSVHTISLFMKAYMEVGNANMTKMGEVLAIFFRVVVHFHGQNKTINKSLIVYNLKTEEFIKRTVVLALTILKYTKDANRTIWKYNSADLGPQEFLLMYFTGFDMLQPLIERSLASCDFYQHAPLETVIFVKKHFETLKESTTLSKKFENSLNKFENELESYIAIKNQQTFNEQILNGIGKEYHERVSLIEEEARRLAKDIEGDHFFVPKENDDENFGSISGESAEVNPFDSQPVDSDSSSFHSDSSGPSESPQPMQPDINLKKMQQKVPNKLQERSKRNVRKRQPVMIEVEEEDQDQDQEAESGSGSVVKRITRNTRSRKR